MSVKRILLTAVSVISILSIVTVLAKEAAPANGNGDSYKIGASEILSNRHVGPDSGLAAENRLTTEGYELKLENERLSLYMDEVTASVRVVDKTNGYIWGMTETTKPENLNTSWSKFGNSVCTVEYYDKKGTEQQMPFSDEAVKKTYAYDQKSMTVKAENSVLSIALELKITLLEHTLNISVDDKSLKEKDNLIKSVYFMPFFGCTVSDTVDGYMFVPDGCGALIRYQKSTKYLSVFEKKVYGKDLSIDILETANDLKSTRPNDFEAEEPQINMAVFGVNHGTDQNAFLAAIDGGQEYASITASFAGMITDYNWVTARFDYRQKYNQPTGRTGGGVLLPQPDKNSVNPSTTYYFLNGDSANYSGFAATYRQTLLNSGLLTGEERKDANIPLLVDLYGADIKKEYIGNSLNVFTAVSGAQTITEALKTDGIDNLSVIFTGWQKGGISGSKFGETAAESKLGNKADFEKLQNTVSKSGRFYYSVNPVSGTEKQLNMRTQTGNAISKALIKLSRSNKTIMFPDTYFVKSPLIDSTFQSYEKALVGKNLAVREVGTRLYADYTTDRAKTRSEIKQEMSKIASGASAVFGANEYMLGGTGELLYLPSVNSQYLYETDSVPFLQMVLKGSRDMYAQPSNLGFYSRTAVLKMIEYGMYPSFILTEAGNEQLRDTPESDLFSTCFDDWREQIGEIYSEINEALKSFEGAKMLKHTAVRSGVVCITYDNGKKLYINYNAENHYEYGATVPAEGYLVA